MREVPDGYADEITRSRVRRTAEVTSWLDGDLLGTLPVQSGTLTVSYDQIPGSLDLTVLSTPETRPTTSRSMLAAVGQQLIVRRAMMSRGADPEPLGWIDHGVFRVQPVRLARQLLRVQGLPLESTVQLARFTQPTTFPASTYAGMLGALLKGLLPVRLAAGVVDRAIKARTWEEERLDAVQEVLTAWGGVEGRVMPDGVFEVRPTSTSRTPVLTLHDGPGGTVQTVQPAGDREMPANCYTVATVPDDGSVPMRESAYLTDGPRKWGGPYGYVTKMFASPLLTTRPQLRATAQTMLTKEQQLTTLWEITCLSDDRIELGDCIRVTTADVDLLGRVIEYTIPLTDADEPGSITVTAIGGTAYGQAVDQVI